MDFVHDQLATGRKMRVLTIVDTYSRFSPAVDPRFSYRGEDVVATARAGLPERRLSQGNPGRPGLGVHQRAISICGPIRRTSFSTSPGPESRPTTASSSPFNGKFRAECLNTHWFMSLDDARIENGGLA
jgi:putative transposase